LISLPEMANFVITSSANSFLVEIDGKKASFRSGDIHPYNPDGSGDTVYIYETTGILKALGRSVSVNDPNLSKDRIPMTIGTDTIDIDGTTVFADADALFAALEAVFFLASPDSPLIPDDQRVNTFADLPDPVVSDGKYYVVDIPTGTWILGTRKETGIYKAVSGAWAYRGPDVPYYLMDDQFTIKDGTDNSKQLGFEVGNIAPANRRIATWQDKDGEVAYTQDVLGGLNSGLFTGGEVTINAGDNTTFDVAAGTGVVVDWTDPANPVRTLASWAAFTAEAVPDIGAVFTVVGINANGSLVKQSGAEFTPGEKRATIQLQTLSHASGVIINAVSGSSQPAYEVIQSILDYIDALGPINSGNDYSANGVNLEIDKSAGTTVLPFINRVNDVQNPSIQTNAATVSATLSRTFRDGLGGFIFIPGNTVIDPDNYDDGSGVLAAVGNNKWTIQRLYFFGQVNITAVTYGQAEYNSMDDAEAAILLEAPELDPLLGNAAFVTALIVVKDATDLSDPLEAKFVCIATR